MVTFAAPPSHLWIRCYSAHQFCSKQLRKLSERPLKWSLAVSNIGRVDGPRFNFYQTARRQKNVWARFKSQIKDGRNGIERGNDANRNCARWRRNARRFPS